MVKTKQNKTKQLHSETNLVISLKNVSKQFKLPHQKKNTLLEKITSLFGKNYHDTFYALKNINLEINKGEFIGIIGQNGAGKSTLLRTIVHILEPTTGTIFTKGKIVSFIDLGVGFQDDLTAKENIYLYGAVMGLTKKEIRQKYDSIVQFAHTEKFMDAKLQVFSSGMIVRLAFATAIQTNPEILILDELFAVGDKEFQNQCHKILQDLKSNGTTILFSSHDLKLIKQFCNETIYMRHGKIIMQGDTDSVINRYLKDTKR